MDVQFIKDKISAIEKEIETFRVAQEKIINKMLYDAGILQYMFNVEKEIAVMQGKIQGLNELLGETEEEL